jgi:hypothetical protein
VISKKLKGTHEALETFFQTRYKAFQTFHFQAQLADFFLQLGAAVNDLGKDFLHTSYQGREILTRIEGRAYDVSCALSFLKLSYKAVILNVGGLKAFD